MPVRCLKQSFKRFTFLALSLFIFTSCDNVVSQFVKIGIGSKLPSANSNDMDTTAPEMSGTLADGTNHVSLVATSTLTWTAATDVGTGVSSYDVAIGTTAGASDVTGWTNVGNVTSIQISSLSLSDGTTYYASVRAKDLAGNVSTPLQSDGWIAIQPPLTIVSVDDDIAHHLTTATPTITWDYPGTLVGGSLGYHFEVAVGSTAGASDVVAWETAGTAETWSKSGLSLTLNNTYYASVRIVDSSNTVYTTVNGNGWKVVPSATVAARYAIAQNWNQYADRSNTNNTCPDSVKYFSCIHGGESKRVNYAAAASCTGYTAADALGAFDWACDDTGGAGNVFFYSRGLKEAMGLTELLNTTSWKDNRVVIFSSGVPVAASTRTTWWTNTVTNVTSMATLTVVANTIFTVNTDLSMTTANSVALNTTGPFALVKGFGFVVFPPARVTITGASTTDAIFQYGQFSWIEGSFYSSSGAGHFLAGSGGMSQGVIRNVKLEGFANFAYQGPNYSYVHNVQVARGVRGMNAQSMGNNVFYKFQVNNTTSEGLLLTDAESDNIFIDTFISNVGNRGVYFNNSTGNHFINLTVANGAAQAVSVLATSDAVIKNLAAINTLNGLAMNSDFRVTVDNVLMPNAVVFSSNESKFTNNLIFTATSSTCTVTMGTSPGLVTTTCANNGSSNASMQISATHGSSSFVGAVTTADSANSSDTTGSALFATITDWFRFDSPFRFWSLPSGTKNACSATNTSCQIYDFSLKTADTEIKNYAASVAGASIGSFTAGAACPAQLHGNVVTTSAKMIPITYLSNARELMGTGGNSNGLCESNESCLYTPNFGAYQGSGDYWNNTCTFTNGTVTGVKMYAYPVN